MFTKFFVLLFLLGSQTHASSVDWQLIYEGDEVGGYKSYFDPNSVNVVGTTVYAWGLTDFNKPQAVNFILNTSLSTLSYSEVDCQLKRARSHQLIAHKENMGRGKVVKRVGMTEWFYPPPNSADATVMLITCKLIATLP